MARWLRELLIDSFVLAAAQCYWHQTNSSHTTVTEAERRGLKHLKFVERFKWLLPTNCDWLKNKIDFNDYVN